MPKPCPNHAQTIANIGVGVGVGIYKIETSRLEMGTRWGLQNPSSEEDIMHCDFFIKTFIKSSTFLSRIGDSPRRPPRAINHPTDIKVRGPVGARPLPHYYYEYDYDYDYDYY